MGRQTLFTWVEIFTVLNNLINLVCIPILDFAIFKLQVVSTEIVDLSSRREIEMKRFKSLVEFALSCTKILYLFMLIQAISCYSRNHSLSWNFVMFSQHR